MMRNEAKKRNHVRKKFRRRICNLKEQVQFVYFMKVAYHKTCKKVLRKD